jgi:ATP-dependent helicase HrpA
MADPAPNPAPAGDSVAPAEELRTRIDALMVRDRVRLGRLLQESMGRGGSKKRKGPGPTPEQHNERRSSINAQVVAAEKALADREALVPAITYPEDLPVTQRREDLLDALRTHQVVIVAGDTGSGKSTQLPKLCLEVGRGRRGFIGHTQPRRIAARTIAERVASELGVEVGGAVGYAVRFQDQVGPSTLIKVMTDGILLAEIQRDRDLLKYDTIIIDEAHERSLNIDFLLGYLTKLLPRRPDLQIVVTSATIDTERFAEHFRTAVPVAVVEVSGRMFPVEVRYRPFGIEKTDDRDQPQAILDAVDELCAEGPGDVLVFLSGEREIRDAAEALRERTNIEVLPLYARLSLSEQQRIFQPHAKRRVVLATNVAETSLTVPGIRSVIDTGTARISRYSKRLKVQQLPIEAISQASANQRSGRCGRLGPGVAIRLYEEETFPDRPAFTEPEILRTNLASVLLQMAAFEFGDIEGFPFIEPPDSQSVRDGNALLVELGAFDDESRLTKLGRRLARLPLDPRLGRMIIEAERLGCVREVMIITAALSIQDPRERPLEHRGAADELHRRFASESSDFISILNLWDHLKALQKELSGNQFRKRCKAEYLNHLRIREWQDIFSQLRRVISELSISMGAKGAHHDNIHQAMLSGLLTQIGQRDDDVANPKSATKKPNDRRPERPRKGAEFKAVRNGRFAIAPGSILSRKPPKWVMAAEMVETNRLWARVCAQIDPVWIETLGEHLIKRSYSEPRWDAERGSVLATERVLIHGLSIVEARTVNYARINPAAAREIFLQNALVLNDWRAKFGFIPKNRQLVNDVLALEARVRRRDILVNDDAVFAFFDQRVPAGIVSTKHFEAWWKKTEEQTPDLLTFTREDLVDAAVVDVSTDAFPDVWETAAAKLNVSYVYEPNADNDGATITVPLVLLNQLSPDRFDWHLPGFRVELISELIRTLPKAVRRQLVPAPDYAEEFLAKADVNAPLRPQLASILGHLASTPLALAGDEFDRLPNHLRLRVSVVDAAKKEVASGRDIRALIRQFGPQARAEIAKVMPSIERADVRAWDFGDLPATVDAKVGAQVVRGYPALVDEGRRLALRVLTTSRDQQSAMWLGTQRLLQIELAQMVKQVRRSVNSTTGTLLALARHGDVDGMIDDCIGSAIEHLLAKHGGPVRTETAFGDLRTKVEKELVGIASTAALCAGQILDRNDRIEDRLATLTSASFDLAVVDISSQLRRIVPDGFITAIGVVRLPDVIRYLDAIERRVEKLANEPQKDSEKMKRIQQLEKLCDSTADLSKVVRVRWMIEELRVSVFAQALGTNGPISEERIRKELTSR